MRFHNQELQALVPRGPYGEEALSKLEEALGKHATLRFRPLPSGLFPASSAGQSIGVTGYDNVWVRDNVYVAYAHHLSGQTSVAARAARTLIEFFNRYRRRFEDIISGAVDPQDVSKRPQIRFRGMGGKGEPFPEEIPGQRWSHAQNDALGYFLWLYAQLAAEGNVALDELALSTLALFPRYFQAIRFWRDQDSGHWEEVRKISASSIGAVIAGLSALLLLARKQPASFQNPPFGPDLLVTTESLLRRGRASLHMILPHECAQLAPAKNRRYDAALLFLLFPLDVVKGRMADLLLHDLDRFLTGEFGIRRYLGDSYWAPDYDDRLPVEERTRDYSEDMETRDVLLQKIGDEAQWSIFDPVLSAYYGRRYLNSRSPSDLARQTLHLNRALAQITPEWQCPELYYLRHGQYVTNPHVPLQWTQANLLVALKAMRTTLTSRQ